MEPFLLFDLKFDDTRNWYKLQNLNKQKLDSVGKFKRCNCR